ncbi:unnamed protein product [Ilex paraguariensis]|uniref:Uncharacterized protein n=1 Tax=Ilex paraguariensis TaxID=185542 RepID=A0ABC8TU39_9AQUA
MEEALSGDRSSSRRIVLPNRSELSSHLVDFLDVHFRTHNDLSSSFSYTATYLGENCVGLETHTANLQKNLGKLIVSWISRSIRAKTAFHKLKKLTLCTTLQYGVELEKVKKLLGEDMPSLAKELRRIDDIRNYADFSQIEFNHRRFLPLKRASSLDLLFTEQE